MKLFGYSEDKTEELKTLKEVSFAISSPKELRDLVQFFNQCADLMEKHGEDFGHEHFDKDPRIIVARAIKK